VFRFALAVQKLKYEIDRAAVVALAKDLVGPFTKLNELGGSRRVNVWQVTPTS
jgi:hypothetical protein